METQWDYTKLAEAYVKRPDYVDEAIDWMLDHACMRRGGLICDIGAGAAHLTKAIAERGYRVYAVEPNSEMRKRGVTRTAHLPQISWHEGLGEATGMETGIFDLVTFGSSFNVCDQQRALKEAHRILKPKGYIACLWNYRDLEDPLQHEIERVIREALPDYSYGNRRQDQTKALLQNGLFDKVIHMEASVLHQLTAVDFADGWKSHATLQRQSQKKFDNILKNINDVIDFHSIDGKVIVPYTTHVWMAQWIGR
ncbi:MAG: class I SAM-dependent methyltransferase [Clostridiales bacterium]|nr:class I SAM-dependent methyltransferase [Clostridiales bacterium]